MQRQCDRTPHQVQGTGEWVRLDFSLTPSAATDCWGYEWGAAPTYCEPNLANRTGSSSRGP